MGSLRLCLGRALRRPIDYFVGSGTGDEEAEDRKLTKDYAAVGVTWWLESLSDLRGSFDELLARVEAGPPA